MPSGGHVPTAQLADREMRPRLQEKQLCQHWEGGQGGAYSSQDTHCQGQARPLLRGCASPPAWPLTATWTSGLQRWGLGGSSEQPGLHLPQHHRVGWQTRNLCFLCPSLWSSPNVCCGPTAWGPWAPGTISPARYLDMQCTMILKPKKKDDKNIS